MSKEINLNDSNLCITEDVFEEFQAQTLYEKDKLVEDDEFITLADIAPPEDAIPTVSADITEIPYDNEVVLSSSHEDVGNRAAGSNMTSEVEETLKNVVQSENKDVTENSNKKDEENTGRPRRSRKAFTDYYSLYNTDSQDSSTAALKKRSGRKSSNKRGRKSSIRQNLIEVNGSHTENNAISDVSEETKKEGRGRRKSTKRSQSIHLDTTSITDNQPKNSCAEDTDITPSNKNSGKRKLSTKELLSENNLKVAKTPVKRRGRKKKSIEEELQEMFNEEGTDDKEISKNDTTLEDATAKDSENNLPSTLGSESFVDSFANFVKQSTTTQSDFGKFKGKKRGRKSSTMKKQSRKKKDVQEQETGKISNDDKAGVEQNMSDEDGDISLSNLKKSISNSSVTDPATDINEEQAIADEPIDVVGIDSVQVSTEKELYSEQEPVVEECKINTDQKEVQNNDAANESLLEEDTSKRPARRKAKKVFHYEEDSDEDPFANVELSDDDVPRGRKRHKYDSDDEYVPHLEYEPGKRGKCNISSDELSGSDIDDLEGIAKYGKKKKLNLTGSPRKRSKGSESKIDISTPDVTTVEPNVEEIDDIEGCLQSSVIKIGDEKDGKSSEFENFLAQRMQGTNLKIKKVSSSEPSTCLEIPVIDPTEAKKFEDTSIQTDTVKKLEKSAQTDSIHDNPMKINHPLTAEQAEKACEFLRNVVQTTSELGQLMTQKSEDFIKKKINTSHVTDTFKMDYCVKKSFLLFKLAKHNLIQMEEDLAKQYEDFLKSNGLENCREVDKKIEPKKLANDSDSDCEIVEMPVSEKPNKPKFNPKTVFLNKELSIKIAKKPAVTLNKPTNSKLNIKGVVQKTKEKHEVWISESVMVKKVTPTQSFLAQDSRNKKPPDTYVTEKMVSDFFTQYYYKEAKLISELIKPEWLCPKKTLQCYYFFIKSGPSLSNHHIRSESVNNDLENAKFLKKCEISTPASLFSLCAKVLQQHMSIPNQGNSNHQEKSSLYSKTKCEPASLFRLCVSKLAKDMMPENDDILSQYDNNSESYVETFIDNAKLINISLISKNNDDLSQSDKDSESYVETDINELSMDVPYENISNYNQDLSVTAHVVAQNACPLKSLCYNKIIDIFYIEKRKAETELHSTSCDMLNTCQKNFDDYNDDIMNVPTHNEGITSVSQDIGYHHKNVVLPLKSLCYKIIVRQQCQIESSTTSNIDSDIGIENENILANCYSRQRSVNKLKTLCCQRINTLIFTPNNIADTEILECLNSNILNKDTVNYSIVYPICKEVKSLYLIAFENVQSLLKQQVSKEASKQAMKVKTLYKVKPLADICFEMISKITSDDFGANDTTVPKLTINSVNTLSEEAFHNIGEINIEMEEESELPSDDETNFYDDDYDASFNNYEEQNNPGENDWVAQVEMKLLSTFNSLKSCTKENEILDQSYSSLAQPEIAHVKLEPIEEPSENVNDIVGTSGYTVDSSKVKNEPMLTDDQMTVIHDSIVTKKELEDGNEGTLTRRLSFDVNQFESFVSSNKMISAEVYPESLDEIFSQSALRIRRQYDPDSDHEEPDNNSEMSLLVPQTFEPLHVENAKDCLMESSSDESSSKKSTNKKKTEKRGKGRPRKSEQTIKDKVPPPPPPVSEVARLTRRMKDRIRQEERRIESSDSDTEASLPLNVRREKDRKEKMKPNKIPDDEIQCNNVDSTEQIESNNENIVDKDFTGFSAVDQNEISSYQKYVKFVYDKIMPVSDAHPGPAFDSNEINTSQADERLSSPIMNPDEPVEMIECVPTMPMFENIKERQHKKSGRPGPKSKTRKVKDDFSAQKIEQEDSNKHKENSEPTFIERHGWRCYAVDNSDTKLFQHPGIILEKLPESFVQTYFRYQNISSIRKEDQEVDKLTNLQTLKRQSLVKDGKGRLKSKQKQLSDDHGSKQSSDLSRPESPQPEATAENADELTPSEDENNADDEMPPLMPLRPNATENHLAKNSLMNESDDETLISKIKQEKDEEQADDDENRNQNKKKAKPSPVKSENLMLTADKMMNKELTLLHAPVVLDNTIEPGTSGTSGKHKSKKLSKRDRTRGQVADEDSSSEEEKQWVSTKEKLLKRMGRKQDTAMVDDAKRAKLVSEFIERRGDGGVRKRSGGRRRRATRKMIEREKQLKVLSKELYGEGVDVDSAAGTGRNVSHSLFKGRRNIRKVIDKKSLARSTVIANMEEFERKRRLNQRMQKMREVLGCEEDVNVLVINGEVCLEYDFEHHRPVVSIHPFFTKVMKSHQYEGVKFMWDACFESLEMIESGHLGGGCILAHCMGLGKTLQVLALLHTVLTHPRVGMQRILVCCPLSTVLNWVDEIHKWIGPVTDQIKVFELSKLKKTYERAYQLEDWYNGGGIFIIGYELFRSLTTLDPLLDDVRPTIVNKIRSALLDPGPDIVVCDEGHLLKNDCSVLAVAMSRVQTKRRIVLTGTPMQNNLREYYCMVNFIKPNLLGTYSEYSNRFENPIMNGQHRDSRDEDIKLMKQRTHILHKVLEGCLQRQEASVLYPYLPKKHEYTLFISLTKCQWDLYKHYMENYAQQNKQSILKDFHILQKIWSHPQVLHNFQMRTRDEAEMRTKLKTEKMEDDLATEDLTATEDIKPTDTEVWWLQHLDGGKELDTLESSNKFLIVFSILDECIKLGDKVLIFSTSLITMDSLEFFLKKINNWSLGQEYYRLDGSVPAEVRQKWCREFNAEHNVKTKLFLISTRAGSLGLNMVAANRVIILDTSWNPAHDIQSIFRVYRFGQKKDCFIYRLVAMGTMEQKIYERAVTKQAVACRVVDEQQIDRHYNSAELTELYKFDEHGSGVAGGVAVGVCDVALLRVARAACLHAVHEHDSLLRGSTEQQLTELERRDAWLQFQEEHATKQRQNQLTSSFALHISTNFEDDKHKLNIPPLGIPTPLFNNFTPPVEVKTENTPPEAPVPVTPPKPGPKGKKGKKKKNKIQTAPVPQEEPTETKEQLPVEETVVKKIMNLLLKYNIHNHKEPREIAALVANVRKIVAYGQVPQEGFNSELTQSIADVLLGKDKEPPPNMPPLTNVQHTPPPLTTRARSKNQLDSSLAPPTETSITPDVNEPNAPSPPVKMEQMDMPLGTRMKKRKAAVTATKAASWMPLRGRPKKSKNRPENPSSQQEIIDTPAKEVATSKVSKSQEVISRVEEPQDESVAGRPKRRAALVAEKQLDTIDTSDVIDLDDDDWQGADVQDLPQISSKTTTTEAPIEVSKPKTKRAVKVSKAAANESKKLLENEMNSILLSDDDEPTKPEKPGKTYPGSSKADSVAVKTEPQNNEVVPLHPSLLGNKNFIKIVAHTYLEGNPMLDEDAALLAAQYSTQKALKEYEATGVNIESGPIYDIAKKVLGIDILKKLQKTNPSIKKEPEKPAEPKPVDPKLAEPKPVEPEPKPIVAETVEKPRPRSKLKPKGLSELMPPKPARLAPATAKPNILRITAPTTTTKFAVTQNTVVPVGLIQRSMNITPDEPEESILPDDDVRIVTDEPASPAIAPLPYQKPIVINRKLDPGHGLENPHMKTVKLTSDGKILVQPPREAVPVTVRSGASGNDTICLDSDDDDVASAPPPAPTPVALKRVALKSTAKKQTSQPSSEAVSNNPMLANMIQQQYVPISNPPMQQTASPAIQTHPTDSQQNYFIIPSNSTVGNRFIKLNFPRTAAPTVVQSVPNANAYVDQAGNVQNANLIATSMPQVLYANPMMAQNLSYANSGAGNMSYPNSGAGNMSYSNSGARNMSYANSGAGNMSYINQNVQPTQIYGESIPQNVLMSSTPQSVNTMPVSVRSGIAPNMNISAGGGIVSGMEQFGVPLAPQPPPAAAPPPQQPPQPVPQAPRKKTVCKPGDILRITKTGQVEILNRNEDEEADPPKKKESSPVIPRKKRSRIRKISTSSSSEDETETSEDPLSCLKDVVHIRAVEDDSSHRSSPHVTPSKKPDYTSKTDNSSKSDYNTKSLVGNTSITKSVLKKFIETTPASNTTIKKVPAKPTVDLTDYDPRPSSSKVNQPKSTPQLEAIKLKYSAKDVPSKITGKSKDIIISSTGKALSTASSDASGNKAIRVTNVEKIAPALSGPSKAGTKRAAAFTDTNVKKKKSAPMTLKDFDIDDIDDIIELD